MAGSPFCCRRSLAKHYAESHYAHKPSTVSSAANSSLASHVMQNAGLKSATMFIQHHLSPPQSFKPDVFAKHPGAIA
eukprot:1231633-Amphidinium_carterae.1